MISNEFAVFLKFKSHISNLFWCSLSFLHFITVCCCTIYLSIRKLLGCICKMHWEIWLCKCLFGHTLGAINHRVSWPKMAHKRSFLPQVSWTQLILIILFTKMQLLQMQFPSVIVAILSLIRFVLSHHLPPKCRHHWIPVFIISAVERDLTKTQ